MRNTMPMAAAGGCFASIATSVIAMTVSTTAIA